MNNMNMEREIDILALIKRLLKRWKILLLVLICCALIGGLLGYRKEKAAIKEASEQVIEVETAEGYEIEGSVESLRNLLNDVLAEKLNFINDYELSKIMARDTYKGAIVYYIDTQEDSSNYVGIEDVSDEDGDEVINKKTEEVVYYLKQLEDFEFDYKDIAKDLGLENDKYVQELVTIFSENSHVVIHTVFSDEEGAAKLLDYVKKRIEQGLKEAQSIYGGFEYKLVYEGTDYVYSVDSKWLTTKTAEIESIVKALDNLEKNEPTINNVISTVSTADNFSDQIKTTVSKKTIIKNAVMYGIVGAMAYALLLALYLIVKGKVLSENEISSAYGLNLLGSLNKGDIDKVSSALSKIMEEDLTVKNVNDAENRQSLIYAIGDQAIEIVASKLANVYKVEIELEQPKVAYRETIRKNSDVEAKYKKQSGGHGQYGHVKMRFEPLGDVEKPYEFEQVVVGGAVPKNYFPAVEKGLAESVLKGPMAAYPVVGVKAILYDGSYHPVDSSEQAFKMATIQAFKKGFMEAGPVLLEPIASLKVTVPDQYTGDVMGDLNKRRGRVLGMNPIGGGKQVVEAEIPMTGLYGYCTVLRSMTGGRGVYEYEFVRYEQCPSDVQEKEVAARASKLVDENAE